MKKLFFSLFAFTMACMFVNSPLYAQSSVVVRSLKRSYLSWQSLPKLQQYDFSSLRYVPAQMAHKALPMPGTLVLQAEPDQVLPRVDAEVELPEKILPNGAVSLSDGKGTTKGKHSIVPSAMTILGSDAFKNYQSRRILQLRQNSQFERTREYLTPAQRAVWAESREKLARLWRLVDPTPLDEIHLYLTHEVPPATLQDAKESYAKFIEDVQDAHYEITAKIIYSSLMNEGRQFSLDETIYINKVITDMRFRTAILRNTFIKDRYLLNQQKYWDKVMGVFNPLLEGLLLKLDIPRPDRRVYDHHEFILSNPDHSTPYLPGSHSLIEGEEEEDVDEDDDDYPTNKPTTPRWVLEREHDRQMMAFTSEAVDLLPFIPENLRIAFINDDLNPRLNFQSWGKKGLLGKGAQVEVFAEGASFLKQVRAGIHYDLVITDLLVPKGGISMMEELRDLAPFTAVIASSKFYPGDGDVIKTDSGKEVISTEDYFHAGIDGYMWYNNNLNNGAYGYIQVLRSLKNYYYYKQLHDWSR